MDPHTKVKLGRTDLGISRISFGTSALGNMPDTYGYGVDVERAREAVRTILAGPANFLDTARKLRFWAQ